MFKTLLRALLRQSLPPSRGRGHRFLSTAPPSQKSRTWKSSAVGWGLVIGGTYYYNTSNVFAEELSFSRVQPPNTSTDDLLPTLDSISSSRRNHANPPFSVDIAAPAPTGPQTSANVAAVPEAAPSPSDAPQTPQGYEDDASQQGAFNEETGEINWDCPCLGGMAHGPCGEQFREAFSCFVFSKEEPKGMDCIDRFKGMQDCFREHPDVYGSELADQGQEQEEEALDQAQGAEAAAATPTTAASPAERNPDISKRSEAAATERAKEATMHVAKDHQPLSGNEGLLPKAWHDTPPSSEGK